MAFSIVIRFVFISDGMESLQVLKFSLEPVPPAYQAESVIRRLRWRHEISGEIIGDAGPCVVAIDQDEALARAKLGQRGARRAEVDT
jgi:hypothetical protein